MNQIQKCEAFARLHVKSKPCVLFNIWDAGGARAVEKAGASAVATGSWSIAAAHGYADGEMIPLAMVESIARQICNRVSLPVSIDFEGGYAETPEAVAANVQRILKAGAVGINFEDQIVNGNGLYDLSVQAKRISAIREMADQHGIPLFINARTDLFLHTPADQHQGLINDAKRRSDAYAAAGASGFFIPGLTDADLIAEICDYTGLPVNCMMMDGALPIQSLAKLGVSRISFGPSPYVHIMNALTNHARESAFYSGA